jgi:hypothetical protein
MHPVRFTVGLLGGLGIMFLLLGFSSRQSLPAPMWEPVKLDFSYLSQSQVRALWRRADEHALAEVILKRCGSPPHVEQRMISAATDCIEARALAWAAAYFRKRVAELSTNRSFPCRTDRSKALMRMMRSKIDRDVEEVRAKCKACMFC